MSEIWQAILLGIVQGLTEFLPVSSSGHLEIFKHFFNENINDQESIMMTVTLHGATALSTIVILRKEVFEIFTGLFSKEWNQAKKWALYIALSMIPAAIFFLTLEDWITGLFDGNITFIAFMLIITGVLLLLADLPRKVTSELNITNSLIVGVAQALAIIPGISRSGSTIATSVMLGVNREQAARFSFLMVLPLIFGKIILDLKDGDYVMQANEALPLIAGAIAAFIVGCFACQWMIRLVKNSKLKYFAYYCFAIASVILIASVL